LPRPGSWLLLVGALVVIAAGCSDSASLTTAAALGPTTPAATSVTTAPAATTTSDPGDACPQSANIPDGAGDSYGIPADLTGDGISETLTTYFVPDTGEWHFRVLFGLGGSVDQVISGAAPDHDALPLGTFDVESDGTPEIFLQVGSNDSVAFIGFYDAAGCDITRITGPGEVLSVGTTDDMAQGITCTGDGFIEAQFASRVGANEWESGFAPYKLTGSLLEAFPGDGGGLDDAGAAALVGIFCGDVGL